MSLSAGAAAGIIISTAFDTSFPTVEAPLNQGGIWQRGLQEGIDWNDPKVIAVSGGNACIASVSPSVVRYADDIAHLKTSYRTFGPDQWAEGTVYRQAGYSGGGGKHEIELHLRWATTANNAIGYEWMWGADATGNGYTAFVRWDGAAGSYTSDLAVDSQAQALWNDGDVAKVQIVGNLFYAWINGNLVANYPRDVSSVFNYNGTTIYSSGQPGLGFWPVDGASIDGAGWRRFRCDDH